jgi:peroxiredoxin
MRLIAPLLFPLLFALNAFAQEVMEVPISLASGYSVFHASMATTGQEAEDSPFKSDLKGIPENLKNIRRHHYIADEKQFFYQNYISKKISTDAFEQRMQLLKYEPDEKELSKKPLRASVYIITGEDEKGNSVWFADTDTDLDFSDEKAHPLLTYSEPLDFEKYKSFADNSAKVKYQRFRSGKVVEETFPLAIVRTPEGNSVLFNFPMHYTAAIKVNNKVYDIAIESGGFLAKGLDEENNSMVVLTDIVRGKTVDLSVPVRPNQYFYLGSDMYQYVGVDAKKIVISIKKMQNPDTVKSAQVGFTAPGFQAKDFKSGKEVAIEELRGKYVLLDFWATWCGPCIKEFPRLKALTAHYNKSKFEVVGIIGASRPEDVARLIDKHELTWKQLLSDEIVEQHGVNYYPSTLLISPEGKVIYKDIKGEELEKVLAELIQ